jgi:hypothetical protein
MNRKKNVKFIFFSKFLISNSIFKKNVYLCRMGGVTAVHQLKPE